MAASFDAVTQSALPSSTVTHLHLLRHPHVETGGRRLAYGHTNFPLSVQGQQDASALVAFAHARLPRPDGVISSDLGRCVAVAAPLAAGFSVPIALEPALREQHMGDWEGAAWEDLTAADEPAVQDYWNNYLHARPPGGESLADLAARVEAWWADRGPFLAGGRWMLVTHIGVIRVLCCHLLGLPYDQALRLAPARPSHTHLLVASAGAVLEVLGERPPPIVDGRVVVPAAWESL